MNLVLDIGNSFGKIFLYKGEDLLFTTKVASTRMAKSLLDLFETYPEIKCSILCAVGALEPTIVPFLEEKSLLFVVDHNLKLPFVNRYESPETLGADRIAVLAAAAFEYPQKNCLIIDAGSCVTYDFLSADGVYRGGAISPGLQMRFTAMHEHTHKLPLITAVEDVAEIGTNTEKSLLVGAVNGLVFEIDGWTQSLKAKYEHLTVILTGGDAQFLSNRLKNTIFANSNFLADGLRRLLDYNQV